MQDVMTMLQNLHRPRLLIRAARISAEDYRREGHLPRLVGYGRLPRPAAAILKLMEIEADLNDARQSKDAGYAAARHVDVLAAMMGEAQLLRDSVTLSLVR